MVGKGVCADADIVFRRSRSPLCLASFLSVSSSSRWLMVPIPTCGYRRDAHGKKLQHKTELLLNCKLFHTFQRHHSIGFQNIVLLHVCIATSAILFRLTSRATLFKLVATRTTVHGQ